MSANNPIVQAMVMQQLGIDPTQQNNNTGALSNPGMGMGVLSMTGNRRGSPAFNSVPTRNEMLIRAGGAMVGASPQGLSSALAAGAKTYGDIMDSVRDREAILQGRNTTAKKQAGNLYYDNNRNAYREVFDPNLGKYRYHVITGSNAGTILETLPPNAMRAEDSPFKTISREEGAYFVQAQNRAIAAPERIAGYKRLLEQGRDAAGVDFFSKLGRGTALFTGKQIGRFDPDNITAYKRDLHDQMVAAAERMKGQGQITENERRLLRDTLGNPETMTKKSFVEAMDILIKGEQRAINLMEAWNASTAFEKSMGFSRFAADYYNKQVGEQSDAPDNQDNTQRIVIE